MNRPVVGYFLAFAAIAMLFLAFGEVWTPLINTTFGVTLAPSGNQAIITTVLPGSAAYKAGVRHGDVVPILGMPLGARWRLQINYSPIGKQIAVPVIHDDKRRMVTFVAQASTKPQSPFDLWALLVNAFLSLSIVAVIGWRKPSVATAALVLYGMGACTTGAIVGQFSWLTEPLFTFAAAFIFTAFSSLPIAALLPFVVRFPHEPETRQGRVRMRVADGLFAVSAVIFTIETLFEPFLFGSWFIFDILSATVLMAVVLLFAVLVYRDAQGEARRRIGWVIAGMVVSAIGYTGFNIVDTVVLSGGHGIVALSSAFMLLQAGLPLALAYAVLRHRVLDIGFALNRTVVYGAMTALVVVVVSLVDWLSGRVISEQRWALVVEALITIGFGFALNWIHGKTERVIDRIVFRARHTAEKRIEYRIGALAFATSPTAIDEAVAVEAPRILDLSSAAVFSRLAASEPFGRRSAFAWDDGTEHEFYDDSLLVRTLRSLERPIVLDDVAITLDTAPTGASRPVLAIPIVTQHELIGFALFGNRRDGALPDPEEIGLLAKLCAAAGNAYGAVEARQWRERATLLERSLANAIPASGGSLA